MSYSRLIFIGLTILSVPVTVLAQSGNAIVVPWSVDNTDAQSKIRQYESFKTLAGLNASSAQRHLTDPTNDQYEYSRLRHQDQSFESATSNDANNLAYWQNPQNIPYLYSPIEKAYSLRVNGNIKQFGYEIFNQSNSRLNALAPLYANQSEQHINKPSGAVQDDFILGEGDELLVSFSGQRTDTDTFPITSSGMLLIKDFQPIQAAGKTMGDLKQEIADIASNEYNVKANISLSSIRQISVLVAGNVQTPGKHTLTVYHTIIDALLESGGIDKTGSLRQIKLVRKGQSQQLDLYALFMKGDADIDLRLQDGDRIIVPPLGPTVAISGEVKRPGIYEILPQEIDIHVYPRKKQVQELTLKDMLDFAGGTLNPGNIRYLKLGITDKGDERVEQLNTENSNTSFTDGSILVVSQGQDHRSESIELSGATKKPGLYAYSKNKTLSEILSSNKILSDDIYPLIGVIERWNKKQLTREFIDFPLNKVLNKSFDRGLKEGDKIKLFTNEQIQALTNEQTSTDSLNQQNTNYKNLYIQASYSAKAPIDQLGKDQNNALITDPILKSFLLERSSFIRGAVRKPGAYPVSQGISLDNIIATAGGLALEANSNNIEVTSAHERASTYRKRINLSQDNPEDVTISAGDSIRVNQKFNKIIDNSVIIVGEVANPGRYDLMPGDKISDLIERAGGLTEQSYAFGAIFSRESERKAEEIRFKSQALEMERSIAAALQDERNQNKFNAGKIAEARALAQQLRTTEGVGRITVEADPAMLSTHPELDLLLESGDRLYIPRRDLTVRVTGEVLSPASLQFRDRKNAADYIQQAGGFTYNADIDRAFVIYPDGAAQPLEVSAWNFNPIKIPPGSTIVVPRDPEPFDFIQSAKDVSQILSNLAVTAIFIDDLSDDN